MSANQPGTVYFPVSPRKFVVLSVLTFGIYEFYWLYQCWRFVKARDGSSIWPFWRAVFGPIFVYSLQTDVEAQAPANAVPRIGPGIAAVGYIVFGGAWRLPDPWWLLSLLSFAPLLPVLRAVNASNPPASAAFVENSAWRPRHAVLALLVGPLLALSIGSSIGYMPSTHVVSGSHLWERDRAFLETEGIVAPGETILQFYSHGLLSIHDDGVLVSDRSVVSYWTDLDDGRRRQERAQRDEIRDVKPRYGTWAKDTSVTITRRDGSEFELVLPVEAGGDRSFVRTLVR